jgi:hypothetical protein
MANLQPRIFIQQAAKETRSAEEITRNLAISVEGLREYLTAEEYTYLEELGSPLIMRGTDAGNDGRNKRTWAEMKVGDFALVAWHGHIEAAGEIVMRKDSSGLARSRNHSKYHFLYFLRNVERLHIPYGRINSVLAYKTRNSFQRFGGLDQQRSGAVLDLLRELAPTLRLLSKDTLVDRALEGDMDHRTEVSRRCEQGLLRRLYFGNGNEGRCEICGRVFPIEFLVAAHIKRRANCSDEERRDAYRNIIPACRFGCDELFERGYILGIEGVFTKSKAKSATPTIDTYISFIEGRPVQTWDRRRKYFQWHAKHHS